MVIFKPLKCFVLMPIYVYYWPSNVYPRQFAGLKLFEIFKWSLLMTIVIDDILSLYIVIIARHNDCEETVGSGLCSVH